MSVAGCHVQFDDGTFALRFQRRAIFLLLLFQLPGNHNRASRLLACPETSFCAHDEAIRTRTNPLNSAAPTFA